MPAEPAEPAELPLGSSSESTSSGTIVLQALLVALILATFSTTFLFKAFRIPTASMDDTLRVGDQVLVNVFLFGPRASSWETRLLPTRSVRRGDVVVFRYPQDPRRDFIKRCIGLPFDRVQIVDKRLFINGEAMDEDGYVHFADERIYRSRFVDEWLRTRDNFGPYTVPAGHYFCLGDNRDRSRDSRFWGVVPTELILGRALLIYWSFDLAESGPATAGDTAPPFPDDGFADGTADGAKETSRWLRPLTATRWHRVFTVVR